MESSLQRTLWHNGKVYTPRGVLGRGAILVGVDGRIEAVGEEGQLNAGDARRMDLGGQTVIPGLIDVHVHGGGGHSMMNGTYEGLDGMSQFHARQGTTSFLATTTTGATETIEAALAGVKSGMERGLSGAELLGAHLEGPFLNIKRAGAQKKEHLLEPNMDQLERFLSASGGWIRLVTLAPELPGGMQLVDRLAQEGVTVSIGHSDALFTEVEEAVKRGARHTTHHFNGMRPLHHREPGVAGAGLVLDELTTELIADGIHVHPMVVKMLYNTKPADRICAITDAVTCAGLPDGDYGDVVMKNGEIYLADGSSLAGSSLTMLRALRNVVAFTGRSPEEVLPSFTEVPAREIKVFDRKGSLERGKDGDFVIMTPELELIATVVRGKQVVSAGGEVR